jgi:hypothetical protein
MTELLVGTKKGLFVLRGEPGETFTVTERRSRASPSSTRCAIRIRGASWPR